MVDSSRNALTSAYEVRLDGASPTLAAWLPNNRGARFAFP